MNNETKYMLNRLKDLDLYRLETLYESFMEEESEQLGKRQCIEKLPPILLNRIYDKIHEVIMSCFSATSENIARLERLIPRICHEETTIPEDKCQELVNSFLPRNIDSGTTRTNCRNEKLYKFL